MSSSTTAKSNPDFLRKIAISPLEVRFSQDRIKPTFKHSDEIDDDSQIDEAVRQIFSKIRKL
jgi:hypothetical protein